MSDPHSTSPKSAQRQTRTTQHVLTWQESTLKYTATAGWQPVFEHEKHVADLFHIAYVADEVEATNRPITFVFNGGPGAASVYLHMGALGPYRVAFDVDGRLPKPPVQLVNNPESWLRFTDLVFIDPMGTGFSRAIPDLETEAKSKSETQSTETSTEPKPKEKPFWTLEKDLNTLCDFIQSYLSRTHRWLSPLFIAGESYGGFRVAKLTRRLQEDYGVGLSGAILISPALEFSLLEGDDFTLSSWTTLMPALAAAAAYHGRVKWPGDPTDMSAHLKTAEDFAQRRLLPLLALGTHMPDNERQSIYQELANLIGLPLEVVKKHRGRISRETFARELLRDQNRIVGLYDAALTSLDPFPDRPTYEGSDPTLAGSQRLFTGAINHHLRNTLQVETDLTYHTLNFTVFKEWSYELKSEDKQGFVGAVDDLRIGMTLNSHMKVSITHGLFDLVTTYFASDQLVGLMALEPELQSNIHIHHYQGGHMFYSWDSSRSQWFHHMQSFYLSECLGFLI